LSVGNLKSAEMQAVLSTYRGFDDVRRDKCSHVSIAGKVGKGEPDYKQYNEKYSSYRYPYRGAVCFACAMIRHGVKNFCVS